MLPVAGRQLPAGPSILGITINKIAKNRNDFPQPWDVCQKTVHLYRRTRPSLPISPHTCEPTRLLTHYLPHVNPRHNTACDITTRLPSPPLDKIAPPPAFSARKKIPLRSRKPGATMFLYLLSVDVVDKNVQTPRNDDGLRLEKPVNTIPSAAAPCRGTPH